MGRVGRHRVGNETLLFALAFLTIYVVWGTTYLAIRVAVEEMPPLLAAGLRFFVAGLLLYGFTRLRGAARPTIAEWCSMLVIGLLMFAVDYGLLFSAERWCLRGWRACCWRWCR